MNLKVCSAQVFARLIQSVLYREFFFRGSTVATEFAVTCISYVLTTTCRLQSGGDEWVE